jgi:predicted RNA-binding Zn ribbon-like protein
MKIKGPSVKPVDGPRVRTYNREADGTGWYFVDTSKAGRRRWCDMSTCGNAEKARRHQRKTCTQETLAP